MEIIDDNNFITSSFDKKIKIWSINGIKPKVEQSLKGHLGEIYKVIFIEPRIYSSGQYGEINIWEKKDQKFICIKSLKAFESNLYNLLQLNLNKFISCDNFGNLICWNLQNFKQELKIKVVESYWNNEIAKINDIKILYGGKLYIQIINVKDNKIEKSIKISSTVFSVALIDQNFFLYGDDRGNFEIRDINTLNKITHKNFLERRIKNIINYEYIYAAKKLNDNYFLICTNKKKIYLLKIQKK